MSSPIYLPALGIINALGCGVDEIARRLACGDTSGMVLIDELLPSAPARIGRAAARREARRRSAATRASERRERRLLEQDRQPAEREAGKHGGKPVGTEQGEHGGLFFPYRLVRWSLGSGYTVDMARPLPSVSDGDHL